VTSLIDRLEKKRLARRVRNPQDRRRILVEPIHEGLAKRKAQFDRIDRAFVDLMEEYCESRSRPCSTSCAGPPSGPDR
jgi:DNA-binding MarR family transcriptional regulator